MQKAKSMGIASLVLGIVSLFLVLFSIFWIPALVGLILAVIGLILSVKTPKENKTKISKGGFITSLIGVILCGLMSVVLAWPFLIAIEVAPNPTDKTIQISDVSFLYPEDWSYKNSSNLISSSSASEKLYSFEDSQDKSTTLYVHFFPSDSLFHGAKDYVMSKQDYSKAQSHSFELSDYKSVADQKCYYFKESGYSSTLLQTTYYDGYVFDTLNGFVSFEVMSSKQNNEMATKIPSILRTVRINN